MTGRRLEWSRAAAVGIGMRAAAVAGVLGIIALAPAGARAFCGFYVSGADASLYANATMVVLMREGRRTVLSMQNDYEGPPERFAMVVPVPEVLEEDSVKTLPREIFQRLDQLAAPRLVEYWERDPCFRPRVYAEGGRRAVLFRSASGGAARSRELGVTVEAEFAVGEYDIVILSARDSSGLDTWLREEDYAIPAGAEAVLRPYVAQGTKFFVAKVDVERVAFVNGKAVLSPLRVQYDAPALYLPIRLGLLNSQGTQDLLIHVLARGTRYQVANRPNATITTNRIVPESTKDAFPEYYEGLFQDVLRRRPGAVVTEYSWDAQRCDPCPTPPLNPGELSLLGADVLGASPSPPDGRRLGPTAGFTLTRLHYRYTASDVGEDLVFEVAPGIVGGRGVPDRRGRLGEREAQPAGTNNFQGRYVILHRWSGSIRCSQPRRGVWGGPPNGGPSVLGMQSPLQVAARAAPLVPPRPAPTPPVVDPPPSATSAGSGGPSETAPSSGAAEGDDPPAEASSASTSADDPGAPARGGCATCTAAGAPAVGVLHLVGLVALVALVAGRRRRDP